MDWYIRGQIHENWLEIALMFAFQLNRFGNAFKPHPEVV